MTKKDPRRKMLEAMTEITRKHGDTIIERVIPFTNDDVPEFLKRLDEFERLSRKTKSIIVMAYLPQDQYKAA